MKKWEWIVMYNYVTRQHNNRYWYENFNAKFYSYYIKIREFLTRKPSIGHFVYETNSQCTLRCKGCHSYMPYFTKEMHYKTNFETFKVEIDTLLQNVNLITSFRIQGGESLLLKDLHKIVEYACSKKQIQHIQVISNGTIIPSQELLNSMNNPKVIFSLSDYSNNKDLADKLKYNEIIKLCNKNHVYCKYWINDSDDVWFAKPCISNDVNQTDRDLALKNMKACHCHPRFINNLKDPEFHIPKDEIVDVVNSPKRELKSKIKRYLNKKYMSICARCNTAELFEITYSPAEQLSISDLDCRCLGNTAETLVAVERVVSKSLLNFKLRIKEAVHVFGQPLFCIVSTGGV